MARAPSLLSVCTRQRILSVVLVVLQLLLLLLLLVSQTSLMTVAEASKIPDYEFHLTFYDKPVPWQKCPEGWVQYGSKCYKTFFQQVSWQEADKVCKSLGGSLVEVKGFNQNQDLGQIIRKCLYQSWTTDHVVSLSTGNMSLHSWIGLKRGVNGDYTWASGRAGHEQQGFWDKGNPPTISSLSSNSHVNEKCCDINLSSTGYGDFRWSLTGCDNKRIFMCETFACNKYQFRCTNSQQCVGSKSVCDGERDCDDGSDELDCGLGVDCGGRLEGPFGTFHSPRFPDLYPDYATCIWQIWTPVGTKVQLQFETFSTELRYDKVEVFDGSERQDSARLGIYSGNQVPVVPLASSNVLLVTFTSDFSQQAHGFNVTWFTESFGDHSEACGGKFSAGTHVQWFTSPLFPTHPYPDNLVCEWIITTHNSSDIITLQFVEFQLDSPYDWVEVHDGPEEQDRLLGHFSGSELPQVIVSTGPCIFVRFKTDLNHGERGFNATYETGCSVNITSGYARISSPGYRANNYRDNTYCVWHIIDNSSRNLTLIFNSDFDTELYMDVVKVYNSSHISERNLVAELSGNVIPAHFHSDGEGFLIIFESDGNVNRPGWTAAISYDCDPLPIKPPLHINTTSVAFGSAVEYQCQEGYILSGPLIAVCGLQAWSPSAVPYCQLIDCGSPSIPMEGYLVHLSNTTYGGVVSYRCNTGYQMQGTNKAVCKDGNWTKLPTCEEIFCPKEPPPSNGTGMAEDNRYGALREYFCNHGYQLIGAKFSHCSANGTWSSPVPQCQIMQCPAIVGLSNGYPSKTGPVSIRDRVVMSCDSGYKMIGSSTLLCTPDLIYDKPLPVCKDIDECSSAEGSICRNGVCQNLPGDFRCICHAGYENPKDDETICKDNNECQTGNGGCSHTCENFQGGYRCTCRPGFQLYNGSLTNYDGLELSPGRTCISVCQPFSVVEGSVFYTKPPLKYGTFLYPAEAFVSCPLGSIPDGPALVKCQQEGGWSASVTACRVSYCPQLNNPDHGTVDTNGLTLNSKASYSCKKGYQLMGTKFRYCQLYQDHSTYIQRFQWTGVDPFCQVNCGVPPNIDNGVALYLHTTLGGEAVYSCDCGYYLTGDVVVQCQENGLWSGNGSTCNVLTCSAPENPIYGIIEQTQYKYSVGSVLEIVCDRPGYDLSDPWPLKCESPVRKQVASALPLYQLAVNSSFETGNNINITFSCGANYQEKAVTLFTQFLSQFEMFCTSPVQRKIVIDSDSSIHISGNRINVTLWAELSIARREVLYDSCTCGEYIAASLKSSFSNMLSSMLESSHDPDCPAVSLLQNTFHASGLGWRCPERLELSGEGPDCWMGIPACWEECEDRIYGTSTLSPYPLNTDNEPITSSLPSETVTTTLPVPVTTSSLPSTYDPSLLSWNVTLSSTDVQSSIASSKPSFTAESETSSESTVKDINVKSTTLPSAISSDVLSKTTLSPSLSVTVVPAFFSLRVEDTLHGSFRNLSCIDAVHLSINKKVVSMMQDFKSHIGKDYCLNASDVIVDLKSGNISFRGNKAEIRIQFSLRSANSSHQAVESCGERFRDFLLKELPAMFSQVVKEVLKGSCENASYPAAGVSVTESDWTCPTDFTLDQELLGCSRSITSTLASTTAATSTPSPTQAQVPVKTIPRMVLTFKGTFVQETQGTGAEKCEDEYTGGLLAFLTDLESAMQNRNASCAAIYVNITANVTLARRGNKYDAESQVILVALDGSVDRPAMHKCAGFVTSELLYSLNHLPNMTLPKSYLQNCPAITMSPGQLSNNATSISYFCPVSYIYDVFNFQCIDETLPSYTIHIDLAITDVTDSNTCQLAIQKAAEDVDQMVVGNTQKLILTGGLCSVSSVGARILLQPQNARLSLAVAQTTISIPLVLVSLNGQIAPVQNCRNELYTYLAVALNLPVKNMTTSIQRACSNAVGPNNYTISSEEWTCFEGSFYNSETHTCVKTGILGKSPTEIIGDSDLKVKRRKRGVWSSLSVNADWNATISSCQDHEAPTFHDCPKMEQRIELGPGGPLPVNISIPEISDNSGGQLFVSFQPPDFHLPYIFHHNMTVNMSVTDSAGNNAVCRMSVGLIDTTPPLVVCPTQVYRQHYAGNSSHIPLVLPLDVVSSWDFSGISHKVFSPSLGTLVPVLQELSITVTVFDFFGNSANCSFIYFIEMDVCPLWTLPEPSGGKRLCPEQVDNLAGKGFSCTVSCSHSYGFISPPPTQYTCVNGSSWQPHNYVPDCALRVYPNQDLNLTLNFTYNGTISNECAKQIGNSLLANLEPVFAKICEIIADNITMNITHMGYFDPQNQFSLKMKVQLVLNTKALVDAARWCGKQIGTKIETFPVQASASCGMASLQPPVDYLVQDTCSDGSILVNGSCLECPQGMHQTGSICMECPSDSYQDQKGQQTCLSCPPGMHTLTNGAKTARECMAPCEPGYYSSNGLVPCFSCPKGWYQSKHRATACDQCISGYSTYSSAATSHENCTAKCWPGLYSLSGLEPCSACPVGFFANETGSHYCLECPWNMTTLSTGSSSYAQCLEIDQCENQPCGYGATCINHFRFFHCICPAGYAGILCDENIDDCASQPCMHGGTCEDHIGYYSCHCRAGFQGTICEQQTNECNSNPCEHGQCIDLNLNYACSCHQGYTGARCEMLIDKCLETPCQHGGMCISRVGGYQCDCTGTGYEGHNCERNINDCSASSCQNGATCNDLLGAFSCLCASGFVGESCEENVDDCNSSPCENGGLCVDGVNSLTCICKPGYTGQQCEEEIDECLSSPCKNGAACIDLLHDYTCSCATGFTGRNCEENIDDCINSLCNMTGTDWCEDGVNSYKCHCLVHWTGKLCQELEDPCFIAPCAEGATCISSGQDFVCTCPADFTGTLCDVQIDNCASRPCLNNGSCVETVHNFMCLCAEGFTGVKCETNVNECWSQPCLNGGTCRDLVNGYACSCVPGYVGEQCEENVDECISQPCLHGATCSDHVSDFHCDCRKGFEGKTCERNVNECLYKPCKNGGTCIDLEGQFLCLCPPNYSGSSCQSGPCSLNDTCQNGATCINSQGKATCLCPPAYAGEDCGKEKSGDYDLWFPGSKDSFCSPPPFVFPGGSEFAVCLWLRFGSSQTRGTYLTLFSIGENDRNNYTMLDMTGNTVSASLFGEVEGRHFELSVTDGKWHHLCYQWAWGQHTLYIDGIMSDGESYLSQEKNLPRSRMRLVLGQPTSTTLGEPFKGLVSHVSLYSYTLKESLMKVMFNNCSMSMVMGDVYSWPQTDAYVKGKVTIIAPGTCGTSQCLPFSDDNRCDHIENKRDRIAPTVVQCPPDQVITNSSVLVQVNWQEPVFEDNVGIISIQQTHRSGQIFQHGEYMVTYVAWDAENNSVDCSFEVIVRPFACVEPLAPRNGAKVCKTWLYGSFCSVTCLPSYMFVEQPPPFYSCGRLGFWDPPRGNPFRFPPCSSIGNPSASLKGGIEFTGPACSEEFKVQLKKNFFRAMWELDAGLRLCTAGVCDFENGFRVTCNPATAIRRRREIADVYNVGINLTITANSSAFQQASTKWLAEKVITAVKQGRFDDSIFIAQHTSAHLTVDYQCLPGQVLTSITDFAAKACFDCPPGYMYDNVTKNCAICGEGSYTEYPRQFHCILCPTGMTTSAPGSTSITACFEVCPQGSYYNLSGEHCELCPKGQYQDTPGQTACSSCPTGHTTQGPGATSVELCRACGAGQELGGDSSCCPCPHGTYRESDEEDFCLSCPYGLTTDTTGSISVSNCTIVVCEKGWYRLETNTCAACLQGTFQPARGTSQCIPCGVGLTTASSGAIHRDQCEPGPVNECVTGSHQCHKHAECMDTENSYHCTCKAGYTGDGYNCTDMCLNYCGDHGVCDYGVKGEPYCNCATGYLGSQCNDKVVKDLSSAMIGGVAGFVVAVLVICIFTALCYWRHRAERKKSQSRIYRTRMSSSAFCNEGYETVREGSNTPSQLIIQEQDSSSSSASSLSIAPRWNRSTFANSDEDETDACWFESLPMDDMSLGCDAFSKPALVESQSYF